MNEELYLSNWKKILNDRAEQVVDKFKRIEGISALILAGSLGGGKPWPLSDIDIIPIYENNLSYQANEQIKQIRVELLNEWINEGWRTALDVGTLYFEHVEVEDIVNSETGDLKSVLKNNSLYHSLDKGYGGKAVYDPHGYGKQLIQWFSRYRFDDHVHLIRKNHLKERFIETSSKLCIHIQQKRYIESTYDLNAAVEILRTYLLESWKGRDNSFARIGTRFEKIAENKKLNDIVAVFNDLKTLDDESVLRRIRSSPQWIQERHNLSYKCRRLIGEDVTTIQDARDVLRVFSRYEMQKVSRNTEENYPEWLCIITSPIELESKYKLLQEMSKRIFKD